ncbi:YdcF family protein [Pseudoroseomonas wenyumeiae]|uniref:YdcF family protein n=1 Tax=Teichococcus wenyumeiae TaxID=2478470 RepID=A0A3A9JA57_9PROT|nr:YdcF family protein [Pseudoroseomonas wenyumeiae]RKK02411.1 YdcF family protein [Pseudoroseomonas wenyumeiae]RMI17247.1 YdcF family protein [Pseudoroseomonas wenyumeiae]
MTGDMTLMLQQVLTALLLPPLLLVLAGLLFGMLAWRGWRPGGFWAAVAVVGVTLLATPSASGRLMASLEREVPLSAPAQAVGGTPPGAIVILGAEMAGAPDHPDIGPMTLERLRAGAALHRRTGLPVLVTGGPLSTGAPPIASMMARSLQEDFGTPVQWVEAQAPDTRGNAVLSAAMLHQAGIGTAYVVTHAWHLPRALAAFQRAGLEAVPAPVRPARSIDPQWSDLLPRPDHLAESWFAMREWLGRLVYAIRD